MERERGSLKAESGEVAVVVDVKEDVVDIKETKETVNYSDKGKEEESEVDSGTSSLSLVVEHIQRNITSCPLCSQNFVNPKV